MQVNIRDSSSVDTALNTRLQSLLQHSRTLHMNTIIESDVVYLLN